MIFARLWQSQRGATTRGLDSGDPQLIYDECWGIQGLADGGVVVGCGTGIEGCELVEDQTLGDDVKPTPEEHGGAMLFDLIVKVLWFGNG